MKTHAQIKDLIDELYREKEIDLTKAEHHGEVIYTLWIAQSEITKPTIINEMLTNSKGVSKEALLWVLSDI